MGLIGLAAMSLLVACADVEPHPETAQESADPAFSDWGDDRLCGRIQRGDDGVAAEVRANPPGRSMRSGADPLTCAISGNNLAMVAALVEVGLDVNWRGTGNGPALGDFLVGSLDATAGSRQDGQFFERRREVLRFLLDRGLDPCETYSMGVAAGMTAYESALERGETNMVRIFEEEGANCVGPSADDG